MSRAFVKEDDDRPERPLPRTAGSQRPNYVTPQGLALLHAALEKARASDDERESDYLRARIESAQPIDPHAQPRDTVAFGASVTLRQSNGSTISLRIVGEDEADPAAGSVSWTSPYAEALIGHHAGERVAVQRPAGTTVVTIESISYD
ncbi:MAG TPA: GreA/GreB family elongation factor [Candidatus Tumulicola sp.]